VSGDTMSGDLNIDADLDVSGHMALGADASVDSDLVLNIVENLSFVNKTNTLMGFKSTWTPSELLSETSHFFGLSVEGYYDDAGAGYDHGAGRAGILYPFRSDAVITGTTTGNFYRESAYRGGSYNRGSGNIFIAEGFYGLIVNDDSEGNDTGDITNAYGARVEARNGKATGVIENYYGMYVGTPQGGGSFTNVYGFYISDLDVTGVTNSYGIYFEGTGTGNGISWAGNTNLYQSEANVLKTDDKFECTNADIGDGTNYTEIKSDGSLVFHGTARTKKSIWIQAESLRAPGTNGATFTDAGITGAWEFADNVTRYVVCKFPLRTDIDRTEDIELVLGVFVSYNRKL